MYNLKHIEKSSNKDVTFENVAKFLHKININPQIGNETERKDQSEVNLVQDSSLVCIHGSPNTKTTFALHWWHFQCTETEVGKV